jgi:hypothetical protein
MVFIRAKTGPANIGDSPSKFTVQYFDEQGNHYLRPEYGQHSFVVIT